MTISPDTIRTVIEIVPDYDHDGDDVFEPVFVDLPNGNAVEIDNIPQYWLDALAAAAVRVIQERGYLFESGGVGQALIWLSNNIKDKIEIRGPNRTENTLLAIAEFVKGGFESE